MSILSNIFSKILPRGDFEEGYRPIGSLDTSKPPRGGSGVLVPPSKQRPIIVNVYVSDTQKHKKAHKNTDK